MCTINTSVRSTHCIIEVFTSYSSCSCHTYGTASLIIRVVRLHAHSLQEQSRDTCLCRFLAGAVSGTAVKVVGGVANLCSCSGLIFLEARLSISPCAFLPACFARHCRKEARGSLGSTRSLEIWWPCKQLSRRCRRCPHPAGDVEMAMENRVSWRQLAKPVLTHLGSPALETRRNGAMPRLPQVLPHQGAGCNRARVQGVFRLAKTVVDRSGICPVCGLFFHTRQRVSDPPH